jgi:hypothetical protein
MGRNGLQQNQTQCGAIEEKFDGGAAKVLHYAFFIIRFQCCTLTDD